MRTRACTWKYTRRYYREKIIYITSDLFYSLINSNKAVVILINRFSLFTVLIVLWGESIIKFSASRVILMLRYGWVRTSDVK